jgi:hypothetical protein
MDRDDQGFVAQGFLDGGKCGGHGCRPKRARCHSIPSAPGFFVSATFMIQHLSARIPDSAKGYFHRKEPPSFPMEIPLSRVLSAYPARSNDAVNEL